MARFISGLLTVVCVVLLQSSAGSAHAAEALPSQDQALTRALENHPDIVAAKAKVALAEAELYGKRMEVSRQVLELFGNLKRLELAIVVSKAALNRSKSDFDRVKGVTDNGVVPESEKAKIAAEVQTAEAELVHATSQREQVEKELRLMIGAAAELKSNSDDSQTAVARQMPQGPIVEQMKIAREKPIQLDFVETPLIEVASFLTASTGIKFSLQTPALDEEGIRTDEPITLSTKQVPLHAALQAFEDEYPQLQFVLRDYGVLVTSERYVDSRGYLPVLDLAKESAATPRD